MPHDETGANVLAHQVAKWRGDLGLPVREVEAPGTEFEHAMSEKARKNAATRYRGDAGDVGKNAEFMKAVRDAEVEQTGAVAAAG